MTDPIDFGPSEMRLLEIGALQERVRVLEAHIANLLRIGSDMVLALRPDDRESAIKDWFAYQTEHGTAAIIHSVRERRARALSEMAATDAELLEPLPPKPDCA